MGVNIKGIESGVVFVVIILENGAQEGFFGEMVDEANVADIGGIESAGVHVEFFVLMIQE